MAVTASALDPTAIAADTETEKFDRAFMAPYIVCLQWGTPDGSHGVVPTPGVRDAIAELFAPGRHRQIWFHNGPYDIACMLEWYPDLAPLIWGALERLEVFDTMWLERMIQIANGAMSGPLGLAMVAPRYGLPAPTKEIAATHPDTGETHDVRTSFRLWYGADTIPEPWFGYADYDGVVTIQLAERQVARWCTPKPGQRYASVDLRALAETTRKYVCLGLSRVYGLRVNPEAVGALKGAAKGALMRLQEVALENGFISPVPATRTQVASGMRAADLYCPVKLERRPAKPLDPVKLKKFDEAKHAKKVSQWEKRQARHRTCAGCKYQARDEVTGELKFKKNTDVLKAMVVKAYEGHPPITEPKKGKDGKKTGGGNISTSMGTLQDSQNEELERWAEYNQWAALMAKDMKIFAHSPVHTNFGLANTMRPTSYDPNILNFRRTSFYIATCPRPECGYETTIDPRDYKGVATVVLCPHCEPEGAPGCH